jgi:hypothetical protein
MRWNVRRRQVTSIVYVRPSEREKGARAKEPKESPWTSLEVAKLLVGAATPAFIAIFAAFMTWQSHEQDVDRSRADELRAEKQALYPVAEDLRVVTSNFELLVSSAEAASDASWFQRNSAELRSQAATLAKKVHDKRSELKEQVDADWRRIGTIAVNDPQVNVLKDFFNDGVMTAAYRQDECLQMKVATSEGDAKRRMEMTVGCSNAAGMSFPCMAFIQQHLSRIEDPIGQGGRLACNSGYSQLTRP